MRALRDPAVIRYMPVWMAWRRYQQLPEAGGYLEQDAQTMQALDAMESAAAYEHPDDRRRHREALRRARGPTPHPLPSLTAQDPADG